MRLSSDSWLCRHSLAAFLVCLIGALSVDALALQIGFGLLAWCALACLCGLLLGAAIDRKQEPSPRRARAVAPVERKLAA